MSVPMLVASATASAAIEYAATVAGTHPRLNSLKSFFQALPSGPRQAVTLHDLDV